MKVVFLFKYPDFDKGYAR